MSKIEWEKCSRKLLKILHEGETREPFNLENESASLTRYPAEISAKKMTKIAFFPPSLAMNQGTHQD